MRKPNTVLLLGALAMLATTGVPIVISTYPQAAYAQTQGMNRRAERRDTRQGARTQKHECNAAGGNSRSECRQQKRTTKQAGRLD
jgi:hypothetical protein